MDNQIPGILQQSGQLTIRDLIKAGLDVDLDLNQVSIDKVNNLSYANREVTFAIKALVRGLDGSDPKYKGETNVVYERFIADNYFSKFEYHIQLDPPYTVKRVRDALNAQTQLYWDPEDFNALDTTVLTVNSSGRTQIPAGQFSKRLYLEISNSRMTVVITPVGLLNIARLLPPSMIRPPSEYFDVTDRRTNLALRLPDANGVIVADELVALEVGQILDQDLGETAVKWMSVVYGLSDGPEVSWVQLAEPSDFNIYGAEIVYNGELMDDLPPPYNDRLDHVLVFKLSEEHCLNYFGHGIIYYNLSRIGTDPEEPVDPEQPGDDLPLKISFITDSTNPVIRTLEEVRAERPVNVEVTENGTLLMVNGSSAPYLWCTLLEYPFEGERLDVRITIISAQTSGPNWRYHGITANGSDVSSQINDLPEVLLDCLDPEWKYWAIRGDYPQDSMLELEVKYEVDDGEGNWLNVLNGELTPMGSGNEIHADRLKIEAFDYFQPEIAPYITHIRYLGSGGVVYKEVDLSQIKLISGEMMMPVGGPGPQVLINTGTVEIDFNTAPPEEGYYAIEIGIQGFAWQCDGTFYIWNQDNTGYRQFGQTGFEPTDDHFTMWFV